MFSKILIKLIDQAIVPAILLVAVRIVSIILIAKNLGFNVDLTSAGMLLVDVNDKVIGREMYVMVNSYSVLFMVAALSVGIFYLLFKSFVFHDSHISPQLTAKVFSLRMDSLIQNSFDLYSQGTIWLSYLFLLLAVSALMLFFGVLYSWIFYATLVFAIAATVLLVLDIENEVLTLQTQEQTQDEDDYVLTFSEAVQNA